jgi:hypothetical protein
MIVTRPGAIVVFLVLAACVGRQPAPVDPACAKGLELMEVDPSEAEMKQARSHFLTSCETGHGTGCFHLALMWEKGMGGHEDKEYALQLLRRGCDLGESQACSVLNARLKMNSWEGGQDSSVGWP